MHIATDGESYGHHHHRGDGTFLALPRLESNNWRASTITLSFSRPILHARGRIREQFVELRPWRRALEERFVL